MGGYEIPCYKCLGSGCKNCSNSGWLWEKKKPKELKNDKCLLYFRLYRHLKNYGIWPKEGGLYKQNSKFVKVLEFCDIIAGVIAKKQMEIREDAEKVRAKGFKNG